MPKISVKGLDDLEKALRENATMNDVKRVVRQNGAQLQRRAQQKADFKGHYEWVKGKGKTFVKPTGTTKRSIKLEIQDGGLTAEVEPHTEYSPYLEYGTRFMDAQPFMFPALGEQKTKFKADMHKLVK